LDTRAHALDHVWRKLFIEELAKAAVLWGIEKKHPPGKDLIERSEFRLHFAWECRRERMAALTGETRIVQARHYVSVTRYEPRTIAKLVCPV
jgi:hypothetical protein